MLKKILIANRGEIAIRAFRAASELGIRTVAVYPHEDRDSLHRLKADEAYQIGEVGKPVQAYLDVEEIIRVAVQSGADAIYPGYGFLSENDNLARRARENGIVFIGPSEAILRDSGDKVLAKQKAREAGVPVLASTSASDNVQELLAAAAEMEYPIFVKAVAGGGGRGMRRVDEAQQLPEAIDQAMREARTAFGDSRVFLEQAIIKPRHIEVQILADKFGNTVHLFERDCSVQRRNQKVVEIAPAPNVTEQLREVLYRDAIAFCKTVGYENAGTVEFLVDSQLRHYFIEINPRIQVEHTVTEEITDVDLVQSQLRIAFGHSLPEMGLTQENIKRRGAALQCRITTENPAADFRPDTGRITAYHSPGGAGIRLDGGTVNPGVEISPYFDSMLAKMTCRGADFTAAVSRARRGLSEFRIRGVATNIPFLQKVLDNEDFLAGRINTAFIEERPHLLHELFPDDRGSRLVHYLGHITVNQPYGRRPAAPDPAGKLPAFSPLVQPPGSRSILLERGPEGFAAWLKERKGLAVTDTTFRDAHQSLLATRVRTIDLLQIAPYVGAMLPQLFSAEVWGGATYDVALRFLHEDPWQRLEKMREAMPNVCLQMLLRGRNTVGYTPYPEQVTRAFVAEAVSCGIDIFRVFDALNDVEQMTPAIRAVRESGAVAEVALCYTGNLLDPNERLYTLDYYLKLAESIVESGAHIIAIKDMAGLLRPAAATRLVQALKARFDLPIHLHTHDTPGGQLATLLAAAHAGVDAVDAASAPLAGNTSQPPMSALVAATDYTEHATGLSLAAVNDLEPYWEALRRLYAPFESALLAPTGRVYNHEIPGGQLSNLRQQAIALGLANRFELIEDMYAAVNRIFGSIPKVTPSSKVVGDLALYLAAIEPDLEDFAAHPGKYDLPDSVVAFLAGELGSLPGGWPEPFRSLVLAGREVKLAQGQLSADAAKKLEQPGRERQETLNALLFPEPTKDFERHQKQYGELSLLKSEDFFYGLDFEHEHRVQIAPGVKVLIRLEAIGKTDSRGLCTLMVVVNGQLGPIIVKDESVSGSISEAPKADPANPRQVASPFAGLVTMKVGVGDTVAAGQTVATIEAMKMTASITVPVSGKVQRVAIASCQQVNVGDLILEVED